MIKEICEILCEKLRKNNLFARYDNIYYLSSDYRKLDIFGGPHLTYICSIHLEEMVFYQYVEYPHDYTKIAYENINIEKIVEDIKSRLT